MASKCGCVGMSCSRWQQCHVRTLPKLASLWCDLGLAGICSRTVVVFMLRRKPALMKVFITDALSQPCAKWRRHRRQPSESRVSGPRCRRNGIWGQNSVCFILRERTSSWRTSSLLTLPVLPHDKPHVLLTHVPPSSLSCGIFFLGNITLFIFYTAYSLQHSWSSLTL